MSQSRSNKKNEHFRQQISTAKKLQYFEEVRRALIDAQLHDRHEEELEKEIELMKLFDSREDYEHAMKLYEKYEKDERDYLDYLQEMEEESMNFEKLAKQKELQAKKKRFQELFGPDVE